MPKPDELITGIAALVESGQSSRMSLTVVTGGAVLTGRLAPEAVWRQRVSEVLTGSAQLKEFAAIFDTVEKRDGPPTHLHFHVARILQGTMGIPETGGMYRVAIEDVSAWTVGDFSYSEH
jgi:hemolysin III